MPSLTEMLNAIYGVYRFARLDPAAPGYFNLTPNGFWRSLFAAALTLPAHAAFIMLDPSGRNPVSFGLHAAVLQLLTYIIAWLAFPLAVYYLLGFLDRRKRFLSYIIPYNWASVPISYMVLLGALISLTGMLPQALGGIISVLIYAATFAFLWHLARTTLKLSNALAIGFVVFDIVFSVLLLEILGAASTG